MRLRGRVLWVARATLKEALRDKVLLVVVLFAMGLVLGSRVLGWLSVEDELKMVQDFSLSGMSLMSLCLAMLVAGFSLAKEVERKTTYTLLTRDLGRGEFILGKYLGLVAVVWLCLAGASLVLAVWLSVWGGTLTTGLLAAVAGLFLESLFLIAVALFLGSMTGPILAAVGTLVLYVVGHSTEALRGFVQWESEHSALYNFGYKIFPNLEDVNFINATTHGHPVAWMALAGGALAMVCWSTVLLSGAAALFGRREF